MQEIPDKMAHLKWQDSFKGKEGLFHVFETEDGGPTVWSSHYAEAFHCRQSSWQETMSTYVEGCEIIKKAELLQRPQQSQLSQQLRILEIGLGIGVGYEATTWALTQQFAPSEKLPFLFYLAVEKEMAPLQWKIAHQKENVHSKSAIIRYPQLAQLQRGAWYDIPCWQAHTDAGSLVVLEGEARSVMGGAMLSALVPPFYADAIYQDAFSPMKNGELWTVEWFELLKKFSSPSVILSSFSASSRVRKSLLQAQWKIHEGKCPTHRRPPTRAMLEGESSEALLQRLERSHVLPMWDEQEYQK